MTPMDERSAHRRDHHLTTHSTYRKQISITPAKFEPKIPASERPQTHTLAHASTGISKTKAVAPKNPGFYQASLPGLI